MQKNLQEQVDREMDIIFKDMPSMDFLEAKDEEEGEEEIEENKS